jgi:hypothetical protein
MTIEQEGVADRLDLLERAEFLAEPLLAAPVVRLGSGHELDRLLQPARRLALPDFAEAAAAERFQELVPRKRFGPRRLREGAVGATLGGRSWGHGRAGPKPT